MLVFMILTALALLAVYLILRNQNHIFDSNNRGLLLGLLGVSVVWLVYGFYCIITAVCHTFSYIGYILFHYRFFILIALLWMLITLALLFYLLYHLISSHNIIHSFYGNSEIAFGSTEAVLIDEISENHPIGTLICQNRKQYQCISDTGQAISAYSRVRLLRWSGTKLVVRPIAQKVLSNESLSPAQKQFA